MADKHPEFPSRRRLYLLLQTWTIGANFIGAMITGLYLSYFYPLPEGEQVFDFSESGLNFTLTAAFTIALIFLGGWLGSRMDRHYPIWYERLYAGESPENVPEEARREILAYPYATAFISLAMWLLAGIIFGVLVNRSLQIFIGISVVGGLLTSTIAFFAVELTWRKVIPLFFPDGKLSRVRAKKLPVFVRLLIVFVLSSLYPAGLLFAISLSRARALLTASNPETIIRNLIAVEVLIIVDLFFISMALAWLVSRLVLNPLTRLQQAMEAVADGDLNVQVPVLSNDEIGFLSEKFNEMVGGLRRAELLRNLLNVYVSPEVAREAIEHGTQLGGQLVECTVLFSDLRSFTSLSEQLPPENLIALLNRYMSLMVDVIVAHGGMVNKFGGDSLLAVFGTPLNPSDNHARDAVNAALDMRSALEEFNRAQKQQNGPVLLSGIAVATGPVVAGNVGGRDRIEYTVIGDTVNLAARLQAMSKDLKHDILLNAEAHRLASQGMTLDTTLLPSIKVRGKHEPVDVYVI